MADVSRENFNALLDVVDELIETVADELVDVGERGIEGMKLNTRLNGLQERLQHLR